MNKNTNAFKAPITPPPNLGVIGAVRVDSVLSLPSRSKRYKQLLAITLFGFSTLAIAALVPNLNQEHPIAPRVKPEHMNGITVAYMKGDNVDNVALPNQLKQAVSIHPKYGMLNQYNDTLFNTANLKNPTVMRKMITDPENSILTEQHLDRGNPGVAQTPDGINVHYTFFDRQSDKLLVIGGGFCHSREKTAPFLAMFPHYDIVLFDYQGQGLDYIGKGLIAKISKQLSVADPTVSKLGNREEDDVLAIIKKIKEQKLYVKTYGMGLCYSAVLFAKAQVKYHDIQKKSHKKNRLLFDKLIFDGAWPELKNIMDIYIKNPTQAIQCKKSKNLLSRVIKQFYPLEWVITKIFEIAFWRKLSFKFDSLPYFSKLTIPTLFFHSSRDHLVENTDFQKVFNSIQNNKNQKICIMTAEKHVLNFLKHKELFAFAGNHFFDNDFESTRKLLTTE